MNTDKLKGMLRLETAAEAWYNGMTPREQSAYGDANPRSMFVRLYGGGERLRLMQRIAEHAQLIADSVANDPAHAKFLHGLWDYANKGSNAVEVAPHHERYIERQMRSAADDEIPGSGEGMDDHDEYGATAKKLRESSAAALRSIDGSNSLQSLSHKLLMATDHLRISNHLQMDEPDDALGHARQLQGLSLKMLPGGLMTALKRHAR